MSNGASHGAHEISRFGTRCCTIAPDFGSELCSPRGTPFIAPTFAECGREKSKCHNFSGRCFANASVLFRGHFELSVGAGTQLSLSRPTIWRSRSLLISADKLQCPLLALSGDSIFLTPCPFWGVKRTWVGMLCPLMIQSGYQNGNGAQIRLLFYGAVIHVGRVLVPSSDKLRKLASS